MWTTKKKEIKEGKDAYPKKVCHMLTRHVAIKKERKKKIVHIQAEQRREIDHAKEFIHPPPKKKTFHTLAHLDHIV